MATVIGIGGESGSGKTTMLRTINTGNGYLKLDQIYYFNCDRKDLPWPMSDKWTKKNYIETSDVYEIEKILKGIDKSRPEIRAVFIDTANAIMVDREMSESKKLNYDKWYDLARDIWRLITDMRPMRKDLIVVIMFHVGLYTDVDGIEKKCIVTNGKKLEKIKLEAKLPVMLYTKVKVNPNSRPTYHIETFCNNSTGKSPIGMFNDEIIDNDMSIVLKAVNDHYQLFTDFNPDYK